MPREEQELQEVCHFCEKVVIPLFDAYTESGMCGRIEIKICEECTISEANNFELRWEEPSGGGGIFRIPPNMS